MLEIFKIKSKKKTYTVEINNKKKISLNSVLKKDLSIIDKNLLKLYPELKKKKK